MNLSDGQNRLGNRKGSTSLGRSDHRCWRPDFGSNRRTLFSTRARYRIFTLPESEPRIRRSPGAVLSERIFAGGWMSSDSERIDWSLVCDASMLAMICVALAKL